MAWSASPVLRSLLRLAWPIALASASASVMTFVNTVLVGHLGEAALGGVGWGGMTAVGLLSFASGLLLGGKILVAHAHGSGDRDSIDGYRSAVIAAAIILGVALVVLGQGVAMMLPRATASPALGTAAREYLAIRILGAPAFLLFVAMRQVSWGQGNSRFPMIASIIANLVNAALAWILIRVAGRGVEGSAIACVVAQATEAAVMWWLAPRPARSGLPSMSSLRSLWKMGLPIALQSSLGMGAYLLQMFILASVNGTQVGSHLIACEVALLATLPALAVAEAACVLVGQAHGAGRDDDVAHVAHVAGIVAIGYAAVCSLVLAVSGTRVASIFTDDAGLAAASSRLLRVTAIFLVLDAASFVGSAVLRGRGEAGYAARVGVFCSWALIPTLTWLIGVRWGLGATGAWVSACCEVTLGAALTWARFERSRRGEAPRRWGRRAPGLARGA